MFRVVFCPLSIVHCVHVMSWPQLNNNNTVDSMYTIALCCIQVVSSVVFILYILPVLYLLPVIVLILFLHHWGQTQKERGRTKACRQSEAASHRELCIKPFHWQLKLSLQLRRPIQSSLFLSLFVSFLYSRGNSCFFRGSHVVGIIIK